MLRDASDFKRTKALLGGSFMHHPSGFCLRAMGGTSEASDNIRILFYRKHGFDPETDSDIAYCRLYSRFTPPNHSNIAPFGKCMQVVDSHFHIFLPPAVYACDLL